MTKTLSFAVLHMGVAFVVGYLFTGSVLAGGALALVEPLCNTVVFHLHEKVWRRIEARRARQRGLRMPAMV
mgnify:CR=1 FL=1